MEMVEDVVFYSKTGLDENGKITTETWVMLVYSNNLNDYIPVSNLSIDSFDKIKDSLLTKNAVDKLRCCKIK